ncbi:MAG: glycosyltransferase family 1 protein [Chitinophagaceae bacterium]|nr:MAG: glycosyltransferase family 1 protein [Chitinophagaceae bacterium]
MDIVCFSHLRWDFVFQRPQHLLTRFADFSRVFYIEEAYFHSHEDWYEETIHGNIHVIKMHVCGEHDDPFAVARQKKLLHEVTAKYQFKEYVTWYYTPMALPIAADLNPVATVYDCMDELSAFKFAPTRLKELEKELLRQADVVFTGGYSLYHAKKHQHDNVHAFPSSIDKKHFKKARKNIVDPADQASIGGPRFGFYGVLDERFDISLISEVAEKRPEWQFVLIGPVVKIDPNALPKRDNIHYLGSKRYNELPDYLSGWDIAMVCFALNEATKFISPTKTPEYLAGGKPVISTPIKDVVTTYGSTGLVDIAANADEFIAAAEKELARTDKREWLKKVDAFLAKESWDIIVNEMRSQIYQAIARKQLKHAPAEFFVVNKVLPVAS